MEPLISLTTWAPTDYKLSYNPYTWLYTCVRPLMEEILPVDMSKNQVFYRVSFMSGGAGFLPSL